MPACFSAAVRDDWPEATGEAPKAASGRSCSARCLTFWPLSRESHPLILGHRGRDRQQGQSDRRLARFGPCLELQTGNREVSRPPRSSAPTSGSRLPPVAGAVSMVTRIEPQGSESRSPPNLARCAR